MIKKITRFILLCLMVPVIVLAKERLLKQSDSFSWGQITSVHKPWAYWHWMGSAVDRENITLNLEKYQHAGIGGVHIIPIYGAKGYESQYIDFLSPQWMEMLKFVIDEAHRLGMGVDMSTGTGWPFGGPWVREEDAAAKVILKKYSLNGGQRLEKRLQDGQLQCVLACSEDNRKIDLTEKVDENGVLNWDAPKGKWELYAVYQTSTGQQVKRAAPGGEGNVLNPFSDRAMKNYLARFDRAFTGYQGKMVRAFYNDSYEVYGADWTDDFFDEFEQRRGYDLRQQLPALFDKGAKDIIARVKCDYRETIGELLLEEYIRPWVKWSHEKGSITRSQAHGSPGNLIDLYAAADIPETEIFGPSGFRIKGLRVDPDFPEHQSKPDPLMMKFSSSAAHIAGRDLVASESCTWLGEHFKVALSQIKPEIDQLFIAGINHVFFHGIAYSPLDAPWPGWLFYASTNFGPFNSTWRDIAALNEYIARCQSVLQSGKPDNDILLYYPIYEWWNRDDGFLYRFDVHSIHKWLYGTNFHRSAKTLWERGYTFDYISDQLLQDVTVSKGRLKTGQTHYKAIVVPNCNVMPLATLKKLMSLANNGATIIFHEKLPYDVPGFKDFKSRQLELQDNITAIDLLSKKQHDVRVANIGKGNILMGKNLGSLLTRAKIKREPVVDNGIQFIRLKHESGFHYFLSNLSESDFEGWVPLGTSAKSVVILDPLTSKSGEAALRSTEHGETEIYLQLQSGESLILRTFLTQTVKGKKWKYFRKIDQAVPIEGQWKITFIEGGPALPSEIETDKLASWTKIGDDKARIFSGTAKYSIGFAKPKIKADEWILDLGMVCESARVKINGRQVGVLWSLPFQIPVGDFLVDGENVFEIEVTNLAANRIADLDRRGVNWKKFHNINFVNIKYKKFDASTWEPMDSGLLGPVRLIPAQVMEFRSK